MYRSFWFFPLLRLSALTLVSLLIGGFFGLTFGLIAACLGLLFFLAMQLKYLAKLRLWLKAPRQEEIPEGWGAWGDVFAELYRAHRRESKSRDRLAAALDRFVQGASALPDGIVLIDEENKIEWCNAMAERHLAIESKRDRGFLITNLVRQPDFVEYLRNEINPEPLIFRAPHQSTQVLSIQLIPFTDDNKILISRDITQIERAETIRRDFIANISHELRTPMTVIHGFLEHLVNDEARQGAGKFAHLMFEQSQRILRLIDDLLTLSRLEAQDHVHNEETIDMPTLVGGLLVEAKSLSAGRHTLSSTAAPQHLLGNREELRSALTNLVTNAIRYTPEGGKIELIWEVDNSEGRFSVQDNGIGIPVEHIPRLTERFYRVDQGRSRETGGTGLGLAIVKHVLMRHQALLEIQSIPGEGSRFTAIFPEQRIMAAERNEASVTISSSAI